MKPEEPRSFEITIGAALEPDQSELDWQSRIGVSKDLRLLKSALLYADKVRFLSYGASAFLSLMNPPKKMTENERLEWFLDFYQRLGHPPHIAYVTDFVQEYRASKRNKRRNFKKYLEYKRALDKSFRDMAEGAAQAGLTGLNEALDSGLIEFESFLAAGLSIEEYFEAVSAALTSSTTFPLLDEPTGKLVDAALKEGKIALLGASEGRAKQIGVSSGLLERLPALDFASIDEILDIRRELERPLVRFRAAVIGYSDEIENVPWTEEFPLEIDDLYHQHIAPAILQIEDEYRSNKSILNIIPKALQHKGFATSSALGIALSQLTDFSSTALALSVAGGLALGTYDAVVERRKNLSLVESHQLFFYYKAGELLSEG